MNAKTPFQIIHTSSLCHCSITSRPHNAKSPKRMCIETNTVCKQMGLKSALKVSRSWGYMEGWSWIGEEWTEGRGGGRLLKEGHMQSPTNNPCCFYTLCVA